MGEGTRDMGRRLLGVKDYKGVGREEGMGRSERQEGG